jgi:hypothetical protein
VTARRIVAAAMVALVMLATVPAFERVLADPAWRRPALLAGLAGMVVAFVGSALKRGPLSTVVVSLVGLVAVLPWLLGDAGRPVLPGPTVLAQLGSVLSEGVVQVATIRAPAPALPGILLVVAGAWWIVAHVATELMVRFGRGGAALVAVTILWVGPLMAPAITSGTGKSALVFLSAAAVVLLATRRTADTDRVPRPLLPAVGIKLAAVAITAGIAVPTLLLEDGEAWISVGAKLGTGEYEPIADIARALGRPERYDVLRVRASHRTYLRIAGLDDFDGSTWQLDRNAFEGTRPDPDGLMPAEGVLPPEHFAARSTPVIADIEVLRFTSAFLPAPYQPREVVVNGGSSVSWAPRGGVLVDPDAASRTVRTASMDGREYRVVAWRPSPAVDDLADIIYGPELVARNTQLPRAYPELGELARQIYADAGATTVAEQVLALQNWFHGSEAGFEYDTDVPPLGDDSALRDFVLDERVGYCTYFASAMAVMLRETGIPARVAVGFLPGRLTAGPDDEGLTQFTVSSDDAHAWVEVLFPRYGWLAFEPTPRTDRSQIVPTLHDLAPIESLRERRSREAREQRASLGAGTVAADDPFDEIAPMGDETGSSAAEAVADGGVARVATSLLLVLVTSLTALGSLGFIGLRWHRLWERPGATADRRIRMAQRELLIAAAVYDIGRMPHETLAEAASRWAAERRVPSDVDSVVEAIQAAVFGGVVDAAAADEVSSHVRRTVRCIHDTAMARDRALAPFRFLVAIAPACVRGSQVRHLSVEAVHEDRTQRVGV